VWNILPVGLAAPASAGFFGGGLVGALDDLLVVSSGRYTEKEVANSVIRRY
jgi:hypothetical protein